MRPLALAVALAVVAGALLIAPAVAPARAASPLASSTTGSVQGNVTGPALVATSTNATFFLNASGGPASVGGSLVGTITWSAKLAGNNLTSTSVTPDNGTISSATSQPVSMVVTVGPHPESLTLNVEVTSTDNGQNATGNFSRAFRTVVPYTVRATLLAGARSNVLPFSVSVGLDGTIVGHVSVPELSAGTTYDLIYRYPSLGLSAGYHTFTLTITNAHGLVSFSNGRTVESTTFYVAPAPTNNTVWYVVGAVAFFGVLFIYATRVAARRRGTARR